MQASPSKRKLSAEQKKEALSNLDIEVAHRTQRLEEWLVGELESFRNHQENLISGIPRVVRNATMAEFAKYNGDVHQCLAGLKKEILATNANAMDKTAMKRKWIQDTSEKPDMKAGPAAGSREAETTKGPKSARIMAATPKKKAGPSTGPGTAQRARFPITKTPSANRTLQRIPSGAASPSPHKALAPKPPLFPRTPSRMASISRLPSPTRATHPNPPPSKPIRPPSSSFNPMIPTGQPRWPRNDESMLSVNGSPLANPYQFGLNGFLRSVAEGDGTERDSDMSENELDSHGKGARKKNGIIVRSSSSSLATNGPHSRTNSQTSVLAGSHAAHSRSNSQTTTNGFIPNRTNHPPDVDTDSTPKAPLLSLSALVSVPTKDGHVLEFDPLRTLPEELDALEGISDGAKKQAKEDMARLIQAAVERWKIS